MGRYFEEQPGLIWPGFIGAGSSLLTRNPKSRIIRGTYGRLLRDESEDSEMMVSSTHDLPRGHPAADCWMMDLERRSENSSTSSQVASSN